MIFFVANDGTIIKGLPSPVYQGAANANTIYLIAPFATNTAVTVAFQLPNGVWTQPAVMTAQNALQGIVNQVTGQTYAGWTYDIPNDITQYFGTVTAQFFFYSAQAGVITATSSTSFQVGRGVPTVLPETPSDDIYEQILENLAALQQQLNNGTFAARSIYAWNSSYTYGANEITFYPDIGDFGAFVQSVQKGNTGNTPYVDGAVNSAWWKEVVNFDNITQDYLDDLNKLLADAKEEMEGIATDAENTLNGIVTSAQESFDSTLEQAQAAQTAAETAQAAAESAKDAAAQSAVEAEQSAQDAEDTAAELESYKNRILKPVTELPETGDPQYIYALVGPNDEHVFSLYAWENGQWVSLGGANITTNFTQRFNRTLYAAQWLNKQQTITIDGMSDADYVCVVPTDADSAAFMDAGITVEQDGDTLTSTCETQPNADIAVVVTVTTVVNIPEAGQGDYYTQAESNKLFGASLDMSLDNDTYVISTVLKAKDGTVLSSKEVDLPLESVVVGAEYDSETQSIVLTLQNGNTVSVPVGDLVDGLATQTALDAEISARQQADTALQGNIDSEATARESADTALDGRIDDIADGTTKVKSAENADAAVRAQQDGDGANIVQTYAKQSGTYPEMSVGQATRLSRSRNVNSENSGNFGWYKVGTVDVATLISEGGSATNSYSLIFLLNGANESGSGVASRLKSPSGLLELNARIEGGLFLTNVLPQVHVIAGDIAPDDFCVAIEDERQTCSLYCRLSYGYKNIDFVILGENFNSREIDVFAFDGTFAGETLPAGANIGVYNGLPVSQFGDTTTGTTRYFEIANFKSISTYASVSAILLLNQYRYDALQHSGIIEIDMRMGDNVITYHAVKIICGNIQPTDVYSYVDENNVLHVYVSVVATVNNVSVLNSWYNNVVYQYPYTQADSLPEGAEQAVPVNAYAEVAEKAELIQCVALNSGDDLNNCVPETVGDTQTWYCPMVTIAQTILNIPYSGFNKAFRLDCTLLWRNESEGQMRAIQTLYAGQSVPAEQNVYVRSIDSSDNGTTWTPWEEIVSSNGSYPDLTAGAAETATNSYSAIAELNNTRDLNTLQGSEYWGKRYYGGGTGVANRPEGVNGYSIEIIRGDATTTVQRLYSVDASESSSNRPTAYQRFYNGTTWSAWEEIATSDGSYPDLTAGKAISDADGNDISETYATKTEVNAKYTKPTSGIPESDLSQAVQTKLNSGGGGGVQNTFAFSVSIPTSKWSNNTATLTSSDNADMAQITADSFVLFMAGDGSSQAFVQSNVRVTAQGAGTLTLSCDTAPTANLTAAVVIIN